MAKRAGFTIPGYAYPGNWTTTAGKALPGQVAQIGGTHAVLQTKYEVANQTGTTISSTGAVPDAGITAMTQAAITAGLKVALKPHIQVTGGADIQSHIAPGAFVAHNTASYSTSGTNLIISGAGFDSTWVGRRVVTPTPGHYEEIPSGLNANPYGAGVTPTWTRIASVTDSNTAVLSATPSASSGTGYVVIPDDSAISTFFASYTVILDHLIGLVHTAGVPYAELTVDISTEHDFMHLLWDTDVAAVGASPAVTSPWATLTAHLRASYPGITLLTSVPAVNGYNTVRTWNLYDFIGLTWWRDVQGSTGGESQATITANTVAYQPVLSALSSAWGGKQILFGEAGFRSIDGAPPSGYHPSTSSGGTAGEVSQAQCVTAFLSALYTQSWCAGFHWWTWAHPQTALPAGEATSYSLTNQDGTHKTAWAAMANGITLSTSGLGWEVKSAYLPTGVITDTSRLRVFTGIVNPATIAGAVLMPGDKWRQCKAPPGATPGYVRPSGPGYVRYEDLFRTGDTISTAMARLSSASPNAFADGTGYITFPEGVFTFSDFKAAGSNTYGIYVPKNCKGIWGSGPGTLGGSTGTVFTMTPNSWTGSSPLQSTGSPNPNQMMYRGTGTANGVPIIFAQFQIAGTNQGDVDGKCYHGFTVNNPESPVIFQDLLATGWYGDNGAPPGEVFGLGIGGGNGPHKMIRCEADGRRVPNGRGYGPVGLDMANAYGPELHECKSHHGVNSPMVFYQVKNGKTFNCVFGPQDYANRNGGNQGPNHERTDGTVHTNITVHPSTSNALVHMTHSNPNLGFTYDGHAWSTNDGKLTINGLTYDSIYSDGKFYIQSWDPYDAGNGGESNVTAPLVTQADGVTHIPYVWISHNVHTLIS